MNMKRNNKFIHQKIYPTFDASKVDDHLRAHQLNLWLVYTIVVADFC